MKGGGKWELFDLIMSLHYMVSLLIPVGCFLVIYSTWYRAFSPPLQYMHAHTISMENCKGLIAILIQCFSSQAASQAR